MIGSNTFITPAGFDRSLGISFNLPQSLLAANTAEQVAIFTLNREMTVEIAWLCLHLVKMNSSPVSMPTKVNTSLGSAFIGLYGDRAELIESPAGQPLVYVACQLPGAAAADPSYLVNLSPGVYSLLAVNNLVDTPLEVSVSGALRANLLT